MTFESWCDHSCNHSRKPASSSTHLSSTWLHTWCIVCGCVSVWRWICVLLIVRLSDSCPTHPHMHTHIGDSWVCLLPRCHTGRPGSESHTHTHPFFYLKFFVIVFRSHVSALRGVSNVSWQVGRMRERIEWVRHGIRERMSSGWTCGGQRLYSEWAVGTVWTQTRHEVSPNHTPNVCVPTRPPFSLLPSLFYLAELSLTRVSLSLSPCFICCLHRITV